MPTKTIGPQRGMSGCLSPVKPLILQRGKAWEHVHTLTYESEDGRLGYCDHTPKRKNGDFGKTYRHWRIDGKVYKTKEKFLEALKNYNP